MECFSHLLNEMFNDEKFQSKSSSILVYKLNRHFQSYFALEKKSILIMLGKEIVPLREPDQVFYCKNELTYKILLSFIFPKSKCILTN